MTAPKRPVRMLQAIPWPVWGGPHLEVQAVHRAWQRLGSRIFVVLPLDAEGSFERLRAEGITVKREPLGRLRRTRAARFWLRFPIDYMREIYRLARHIRAWRIDLVEGSSINLQSAWAGRLTRTAVVWRVSDISSPWPIRWCLAKVLPLLADSVMINGHALLRYYPGLSGLGSRLYVYYPPVDVEAIARATEEREPGRRERLVIGTIANVNLDKGIDVFVESAGLLGDRDDVEFVVVGAEAPPHLGYAERLHDRALELGLGSRFRFVGSQDDIVPWLHAIDVFVISSRREGSTATAMEAMAAGLPVIAADVGSVAEVVADGATGVLVPPGDSAGLADAIAALAVDRARIRQLGTAGRRRALDRFSLEASLAVHEAACEGALRRARRRDFGKRTPGRESP